MYSPTEIKKIRNSVYLFVIGITVFSSVELFNSQFPILSDAFITLIQFGAISLLIFFGIRIFNEFEFENKYFKFIFFIFMVYELIIIARGIPSTYQNFKYNIAADFIFWPCIIPFAIFMNKRDLTVFYFMKSFYFLALAFMLFCILNPFLIAQRVSAEPLITTFVFTCGFLFLNVKYLKRKISLVAFISLLLGILSVIYLARRNVIVSFGGLIIVGTYFFLRNINASRIVRFFPLVAGLFVLVLIRSESLLPKLTTNLNERISEDTRSDIFENFFISMENDMFFGKGMNGDYYSPISETITEDGVYFGEVINRDVIENGYLQLLLSGGYFQIALFLLILIPAAILGIFKSNNQLSRACGFIILLWLIDMSIYGMPRLIMQYVLVWISVGICYKKSFRNLTDDSIKESFDAVGLY